MAHVATDPNRLHVSGQSLASTPVGKPAYFTISNVTGTVEDVEVNVEGESEGRGCLLVSPDWILHPSGLTMDWETPRTIQL